MITGAQTAAWKAGYVLLVVDTHELEDLADFAAACCSADEWKV